MSKVLAALSMRVHEARCRESSCGGDDEIAEAIASNGYWLHLAAEVVRDLRESGGDTKQLKKANELLAHFEGYGLSLLIDWQPAQQQRPNRGQ